MKKVILALTLLVGSTAIFANAKPEVNQKVLKAFESTFKDPKDVVWHEFDSYYEVNFNEDAIKIVVRYDTDGNIISTMRYYYENQLPSYITSKLKKRFPDRSVYGVTEIYTESDLTYFITMQDEKNWYTVKASPVGYLEQTEKYKKAPTH